jgi:hypothetical protein
MTKPTELEEAVLKMMLEGEDDVRPILRQQLPCLQVSSREFTGVGFFSHLTVDSEVPRVVGEAKFTLGGVEGTADNVEHGFGFVLFVENGVLATLEGFTYDEPWPSEVRRLRLTCSRGFEPGQQ